MAARAHFDYCINCAAFTNTKAIESSDEGSDLSWMLNALAPKALGEVCTSMKTKLLHVSTDYVFSEKLVQYSFSEKLGQYSKVDNVDFPSRGFRSSDSPFPCNVYGNHKLVGELLLKDAMRDWPMWIVMRVSWLYGMHNNKSFVHKFMKNVVKSIKDGTFEVKMTDDEFSIPTSTKFVIDYIEEVLQCDNAKMFGRVKHVVPGYESNMVSRLQFAEAILKNYTSSLDSEKFLVDGHSISEVKLVGVKSTGHQPKFSYMEDFGTIGKWDYYLELFMKANKKEILDWAIANT